MKVAKQAIQFYCAMTHNDWSEFYNKLDSALLSADMVGELALIKRLVNVIVQNGISVDYLKQNKDAVKAAFDEDARKNAGEFFTPEIWCAEGRKYFDKHIPNWNTEYNVWDGSCYSMDTRLYVKRGNKEAWITYNALQDSDLIYSINPETKERSFVPFIRRIESVEDTDYTFYTLKRAKSFDNITDNGIMLTENSNTKLIVEPIIQVTGDHSVWVYKSGTISEILSGSCKLERMTAIELYNYLCEGHIVSVPVEPTNGDIVAESKVVPLFNTIRGVFAHYFCPEFISSSFEDFARERFSESKSEYIVETEEYDEDEYDDEYDELYEDDNEEDVFEEFYYDLISEYELNVYRTDIPDMDGLLSLLGYFDEVMFGSGDEEYPNGGLSRAEDKGLTRAEDLAILSFEYKPDDIIFLEDVNVDDAGLVDLSRGIFARKTLHSKTRDYWDLTLESNHVFLVRKGRSGVPVWCGNCGSGNLMRTAGHPADKLFLSSLQEDDITLIKNTKEYEGATAFQCDFLKDLDYDTINTDFLNKLPERLQQIIRNDEPLVIYMNPPYKSGSPKNTDVGMYMCSIGLSKPAYDIFYQFMWRVMHFVEMFNLKNTYVGVFGPLQFFTGASANILLKEYERCFEFVDGMCLSAQEFSDTSESIIWGIGFSMWKSRGGYIKDTFRKDILLDKKYKLPDGTITSMGKVLYEPPKEKLSKWVQSSDVLFYEEAPLMTSHLTFKGSDVNVKVAKKSGRLATNALGTLMIGNTLTRSSDQSAVLSMPTTIQFTSITEENFWRCVASYTFRRVYDASWSITKKDISAPNEKAEGYDVWLRNALVIFLFEYKSMMSSLRGVQWGGYSDYAVTNKLFYCSPDEIRANCDDEVILRDLEENPTDNSFMLRMIEESKPYWSKEITDLFDFCKQYTLFTLNRRKEMGYPCSLDCWDAGFQQLRSGIWTEELQEQLTELLTRARDYIRKDIDRFGFVTDTENEDGTPVGGVSDATSNIAFADYTGDDIADEDISDEDNGGDEMFNNFDEEDTDDSADLTSSSSEEVGQSGGGASPVGFNFTDLFASGAIVDTKEVVDTGRDLDLPQKEETVAAEEPVDDAVPAPPPVPVPPTSLL